MTRSKLLFTALTLCLAPACDERANIGDRADAALPNDAFASDAGVPVDAPLSSDVPVRPDAPLPNVASINIVVGTIDVVGGNALLIGIDPRARINATPSTLIERFGPCEARRVEAGTTTPNPSLDLGPVVSVRVGASAPFETLSFEGFYALTLTPPPPVGTPVTVRIDLGSRGTIERTLAYRTIEVSSPTRTPETDGSGWWAPYTPNSDFNFAWITSERTGRLYVGTETRVGETFILCDLDATTNSFSLPWSQMNTYVLPSGTPRFQITNNDWEERVEAGNMVRASSSAQSGWTLLRP